MNSERGFGLVLSFASLALALAALLALAAAPASAEQTRTYTGTSFGPEGITGSATFKSLQAVAVDQGDGSVYVLDAGAGEGEKRGSLYKFSSSGTPVNFSALGANVIEGVGGAEDPGAFAENQIAIAPPGAPGGTAGDIYLANNATGTLSVYGANGEKAGSGILETGGETCGVAVDPAGHLFVGLFGSVVEYIPSANPPIPADQTAAGTGENGSCNVAVDALGNIYASNFGGNSTVRLEGLSDPTPTVVAEPGGATLTTDPATDDLYLDDGSVSGSSIAIYSSPGKLEGSFGAAGLASSRGIAIGKTAETAYVNNGATGKVDLYGPALILPEAVTEPASEIGPESATLSGTISAAGGPPASCEFQYVTEEEFTAEEKNFRGGSFDDAATVGCSPSGPFAGSGSVAVSANVSGLTSGTVYYFRVVGSSENGSNPEQALSTGALSFETGGPTVGAAEAVSPTLTSATIEGSLNPNGQPTSYAVEYVSETDFLQSGFAKAASTEAVDIGAGTKPLALAQEVSGLTPETNYHFRFVATSGTTVAHGPEGQFETFAPEAPTNRAYEEVSPPQKLGEAFVPEPGGLLGGSCNGCLPGGVLGPFQTTPDGNGIVYEGQPFAEGLPPLLDAYISRRADAGWSTAAASPPKLTAGAERSGFKAFSTDLSRGVLLQTSPALSPETPTEGSSRDKTYSDLYLWEAGSTTYRPLVTAKPPHRRPGAELGGGEQSFQLIFAAANSGGGGSPALTHIMFEANDSLTKAVPETAPAAPEVPDDDCGARFAENCNLYEWVNGKLALVNVLPGNVTAAEGAVFGSGRHLDSGNYNEFQATDVDHAISADGKRIFWSDASGQVYVRIEASETVKIKDPGHFLTASVDGSKVLLDDGCLYVLATESCESSFAGGGIIASDFVGVLGASDDLSRVYFADRAALAPGAQPEACGTAGQNGEEADAGVVPGRACSIYVFDGGKITYITSVNPIVASFTFLDLYGDWKPSPANRTSQVTPDGRYLTFISNTQLTGYDIRSKIGTHCGTGRHCFEVYEYDLETGRLSCPSCNPTGVRPLASSNLSLIRPTGHFAQGHEQLENLLAQGEGRIFFESQDVLSANDTNGTLLDVYEWTPQGVGSCARAQGCVALVSTGHSPEDTHFLDSTPSGRDAFVVTRDRLVPRDKDEFSDVYDARVGGGIGESESEPCEGEVCKGPFGPTREPRTAGSSTFSSAGNPPASCRKGFTLKHGRCVHKKRHHKHKRHRNAKGSPKRSAKNGKSGGSK